MAEYKGPYNRYEHGFPRQVDSVADLQGGSFPANLERIWLSGYYGIGTPGGGPLYRDDDSTEDDNGGTVFVDTDGVRWKRPITDSADADWFGLRGTSSDADWQSAIDSLVDSGYTKLHIPFDVSQLDGQVDCKGLRIVCSDTIIPGDTNTLVNHFGIENGVISGVHTSRSNLFNSLSIKEDRNKIIKKDVDDGYIIYSAKKNPREGFVRYILREDQTSTTNSLGGSAAMRISRMENLADCIVYKESFFDADNYTPQQGQALTIGDGDDGGTDALFWDLPPDTGSGAGIIRFRTGSNAGALDEVSILFRLTEDSSDNIEIRINGNIIEENLSLVKGTNDPGYFIYRKRVRVPYDSEIVIANRGSDTGYVGGINCYRPGEDVPFSDSVIAGVIDTIAYSRYSTNYLRDVSGMADYALRRHPDEYSGDSPTGGSYHGGEQDISHSIRVDSSYNMEDSNPGAFGIGKSIQLVTNSNVVWDDSVSVNVQRILRFGDGAIHKYLRIKGGSTLFDAVWTVMWNAPVDLDGVRGLDSKETSGVSSEFVCYERGNKIRQDRNGIFGVFNSWNLFSDERLSTGGPYIASEDGDRRKLYYGPILFNKGSIGTIHVEQITEFFGKN